MKVGCDIVSKPTWPATITVHAAAATRRCICILQAWQHMSYHRTRDQSLYLRWCRRGVRPTVDISPSSSRQSQQSPI